MDGEASTTNSTLRGMPIRIAWQRVLQFARPAFWSTLVLSLLSLCVRGKLQGVLVSAFSGLLSLTLIKLFAYVLLIAFGVSLASTAIPLVSKPVRWLGDWMTNVTFDCTSTALGVLVGMTPALAIDSSLAKAGAWLVFFPAVFLFIHALLWFATNTEQVITRSDRQRLGPFGVQIIGVAMAVAGLVALRHEDWKEVQGPNPPCSHVERAGQIETPAAQRDVGSPG